MHGLCERVGVRMESSSPPPYIVVEGVGGLKIQPTKHAPTKHGENMFPCPWFSHMGPHHLPTLSTICGGSPPPWGGPQHLCPATRGCPLKGGAPKTAQNSPHVSWDLVPSRWDKMFSVTITSKKFRKVPEHFRHPLKLSWTPV